MYIYIYIYVLYVHIYSNLFPWAFCLFNIGWRERSCLPVSERQDVLVMRLYIQEYILIFYPSW